MLKNKLSFFILLNLLFVTFHAFSQNDTVLNREIKGIVTDANTMEPLPYSNIYEPRTGRGTISNEVGHFTLNTDGLNEIDTIRFQYVGYKTRNIPLSKLEDDAPVYLNPEIINLSELLVFASTPDVEEIVKNVLRNKDKNYRPVTCEKQVFIRDRDIAEIDKLEFDYKKSSIPELDRKTIALAEEKIPRNFTSYTDFLGNVYFNKNKDDSVTLKVDPIRAVSLKEKDITELDNIAKTFEKAFADTKEDEYWKVKSGIFGQKLDDEDIQPEEEKDTVVKPQNLSELKFYRDQLKSRLGYATLEDKDDWEFLHSTGKYNYQLIGGTRVNDEDVYIIDFKPKRGGMYQGRMFISAYTYALIRADYEYAPDKTGTDFHLLGVGFTENEFSGSIYFEKKNDNYVLKYFSKKGGGIASFERSLALLKKRKRFLWDETLYELKIGVDFRVNLHSSFEYLALMNKDISQKEFADFKQPEKLEMIYVYQFDDKLWKDYSIIEPTEQMKEYKKQDVIK